jgi:mannitol 2-dehydrogenase
MSCDNLPGNGNVLRHSLLSFAELRDPGLRAWIGENVTFPNSMVDGITPVTTPDDRRTLLDEFGVDDAWPVVTEPFRQWVMEDHFCNGRPRWEEAGVQFTSDVPGYEMMKLRLLNAGHSALGYLGILRGFQFVHEAAENPLFRAFLEAYLEQVTPLIPHLEGIDLGSYKRNLIERFSNPAIRDQIARICSEGSSKLPKFILPSVRELAVQNGRYSHASLVIAAWFLYLRGKDQAGRSFDVLDARRDELTGKDPVSLLKISDVFGDLSSNGAFTDEVLGFVARLQKEPVDAILRSVTGPA